MEIYRVDEILTDIKNTIKQELSISGNIDIIVLDRWQWKCLYSYDHYDITDIHKNMFGDEYFIFNGIEIYKLQG